MQFTSFFLSGNKLNTQAKCHIRDSAYVHAVSSPKPIGERSGELAAVYYGIVELSVTLSDAGAHVPLNNQAVVWKLGAFCFSDIVAGQIVWS